MARRFEGLVVLLTGAAGGFGQTAARRLAAEGASLVLGDIDAERLAAFAATLEGPVAYAAGDVALETTSADLIALALDHFGRLDIAINNAGIAHPLTRFTALEAATVERVIAVDLMGVFFAMKHQLSAMEATHARDRRRGAIVNVASVAGVCGAPGLAAYAAAKHAVVGLTRSAALEQARNGIRINALCPSYARTPMIEGIAAAGHEGMRDPARLVAGIPMGRLAEVEEVVEALLFLADPANAFMTGQTLHIDGGLTAI